MEVKNFLKLKALFLLTLLGCGFTGLDLMKESVLNGQVNWNLFVAGLVFVLLAIVAIIIYITLEKERPDEVDPSGTSPIEPSDETLTG